MHIQGSVLVYVLWVTPNIAQDEPLALFSWYVPGRAQWMIYGGQEPKLAACKASILLTVQSLQP